MVNTIRRWNDEIVFDGEFEEIKLGLEIDNKDQTDVVVVSFKRKGAQNFQKIRIRSSESFSTRGSWTSLQAIKQGRELIQI